MGKGEWGDGDEKITHYGFYLLLSGDCSISQISNTKVRVKRGAMPFIKCIILFHCFLPALVFSLSSTDLCASAFPNPRSNPQEFIKAFFSDPDNLILYEGQQGYREFVEEHFNSSFPMNKVWVFASAALPKGKMKLLGWQRYAGTAEAFKQERRRLLDENQEIKEEYQGMEGYVLYANKYYKKDMRKAYLNASAVLSSRSERKNWSWQAYTGFTTEYREERRRLLNKNGMVKEEYQGPEGHIRYADKYYGGAMNKAFSNVSAVLSALEKKLLHWRAYQGTTEEYMKDRSRILNEKGMIKEEFRGPEGYILYASKYYKKDMRKTFSNISAVLTRVEKAYLGWKDYRGLATEYIEERRRLLDEKGRLKAEYRGPEGQVRYADEYHGGDMFKAFNNASTVLSEVEKAHWGWQTYKGLTKEFKEERSRILNEQGRIKKEYLGPEGYARYADEYYGGKMQQAFRNASAVLNDLEKMYWGWQDYQGTTKRFREDRSRFFDENGKIKKEYQNLEGHILYANQFYIKDMLKAFRNVSAVLSKEEMKMLGWKVFAGDTIQFEALLKFFEGRSLEDSKGPAVQRELARRIFDDHLKKAYDSVSAFQDLLLEGGAGAFQALRDSGWSPALSH